MTWQEFPMIICPHCDETFQMDDYYNLKSGDSFYCQGCNKEIYVWATDVTISGDLHEKPEK